MEVTLAEHSMFVPPMIIGILFYLYRKVIFAFNPITRPIVSLVSGILSTVTGLLDSSQSKALVVKETSVTLVSRVIQNVALAHSILMNNVYAVVHKSLDFVFHLVRFVSQIHSTMMRDMYAVVNKTVTTVHSIRYRFNTTAHQSYTFTSSMFASIQAKMYESTSIFVRMKTFFFPVPKSTFEKVHIGMGIAICFLILALTWYYFVNHKTTDLVASLTDVPVKEEPVNEDVPVKEEPVKETRKSIRRTARGTKA